MDSTSSSRLPARVAAVDIGSNTLHLIVADVGPEPDDLLIFDRRVELVRLGADVSAIGKIGPERATRAEATLRAMAQHATARGATLMIGIATEGVRAASNADEMLTRFGVALGAPITLVSGLEEAALTFWGATSVGERTADSRAVADLGGGSCELVVGDRSHISWAQSLPLGSGKLLDTVKPADPPTADDFTRLRAAADAALANVTPPAAPITALIAVGGTANALAHFLGMEHALTAGDLKRAIIDLGAKTAQEIATTRNIELDRVRLITAGVAAWQAILAFAQLDVMTVSPRGVREGAIIAWARAGNDWQAFAAHAAAGA